MSYTVQEVVDGIRFETSTSEDIQNKSVEDLFNDKQIVRHLKYSLDQYAIKTLALEEIFSTPISVTTREIQEPPNIIRSQGYKFGWTLIVGRKYPINIKDLKMIHTVFPFDTFIGIPSWLSPWRDKLDIYPLVNDSFSSTSLSDAISETDTTIPVESTAGFATPVPTAGRFTIENEKIEYKTLTPTSFTDCTRGIEETEAVSHERTTQVKENNLVLFYYKKHFEVKLFDNNKIDPKSRNRLMDVSDEHIPAVINRVAGLLLKKIDVGRAKEYEKEWQEWLPEAIADIRNGRSSITHGGNIRDMFTWEFDTPYDHLRSL